MGVRSLLAFILAVSVFPSDAAAQRRDRNVNGYGGITVYEDPDFRGDSVTFRDEIADLRQYRLNDRISSLEVDGNQAWEVCQDINFGGRCRTFSGAIDDLREEGWNDRISSMRAVGYGRSNSGRGRGWGWGGGRNPGNARELRIVLFARPDFRGDSRNIDGTSMNLGSFGDRARSVQVYGGTWELCEGAFRNARCVTVDRDVPDLRSLGLRNGIDSVREAGGQSRGRRY